MVEVCPSCGKKYVKFPLKNENGKFIWKNLFKMDWYTVMWLVVVLLLVFGYQHDISACRDMIEHPIQYCNSTNACKIIQEKENPQPEPIAPDEIPYIKFS